MSAIMSWAGQLALSMITEELVKALFLTAAKAVAKHSKYKWDDQLVKVLEEHLED